MNWIVHFLGYSVPWQVWSVPAIATVVGTFFVLSRFFGSKNAAYGAILVAIGFVLKLIDQRGRQNGYSARVNKEKMDVERVVERAKRARADAAAANPDKLHEDDGFKRHK